jgi:hypothetical protein
MTVAHMGSIGQVPLQVSTPGDPVALPPVGRSRNLNQFLHEVMHAQLPAAPWAGVALALAATLLGGAYYVAAVTGNSIGVLLRDANAIAEQPQYFGAIDYAEVLLMSGGACISLFTAALKRDRHVLFLALGGILSLLLALDNLYMLHESAWRFHLNEHVIFGLYGLLLVLMVVTNFRRFLHTPFILLGIGTGLFAAAILVDAIPLGAIPLPRGFEDCLELVGTCFWSAYFVKCSRDVLRDRRTALP